MTHDKLRAIVEGKYEVVQTEHFAIGIPPSPTERILAKTLLAVLAECDAIGGNIGSIRNIINTNMQEMGE